jgi:hypothetical protein
MLREFFDEFKEFNDSELVANWHYASYVTSIGEREELVFADHASVLQYLPGNKWSLLILQTKEPKVFDHTRYLIQSLFGWWEQTEEQTELVLDLHGLGYQAVIPLKTLYDVQDLESVGTLEHRDRYGNLSEKERRRIIGVKIRRKV